MAWIAGALLLLIGAALGLRAWIPGQIERSLAASMGAQVELRGLSVLSGTIAELTILHPQASLHLHDLHIVGWLDTLLRGSMLELDIGEVELHGMFPKVEPSKGPAVRVCLRRGRLAGLLPELPALEVEEAALVLEEQGALIKRGVIRHEAGELRLGEHGRFELWLRPDPLWPRLIAERGGPSLPAELFEGHAEGRWSQRGEVATIEPDAEAGGDLLAGLGGSLTLRAEGLPTGELRWRPPALLIARALQEWGGAVPEAARDEVAEAAWELTLTAPEDGPARAALRSELLEAHATWDGALQADFEVAAALAAAATPPEAGARLARDGAMWRGALRYAPEAGWSGELRSDKVVLETGAADAPARFVIEAIALQAQLKDAVLHLDRGQAQLLGGQLRLPRARLQLGVEGPGYEGELEYEGLRLGDWPLPKGQSLAPIISGLATGQLELRGAGWGPLGFEARGPLTLAEPRYGFVDELGEWAKRLKLPMPHSEGVAPATAELVLAGGGLRLEDIEAPLVGVQIDGRWGFDAEQEVEARFLVVFAQSFLTRKPHLVLPAMLAGPVELEVKGSGPLERPRFVPSLRGTAARNAKGFLKRLLGD